ncbi:MAG: hypothetical protein AUH92_03215 [Acidobacteria bacterium 13_1_40CM_4_69_4]|nr:MAG: hypothetical protein AUH92_03215 [Acidobacteria bacterium 13_1_40CM_4_69_4]
MEPRSLSERDVGPRVAYVLKRYPRLSETFILNEILGLERTGAEVRIFAADNPREPAVHEAVSRVAAPVAYTGSSGDGALRELLFRHREAALASPVLYDELLARARARGSDAEFSEFAQAGWIASAVLQESIEHIHAHFATSAARIARQASRLSGVPFSVTAHAKDLFLHSVDRSALSELLERSAFVVAISEFHRRFLLSLSPRARVEVVRNGIDLSRFPWIGPRTPDRDSMRILGAGRLVEKKGFDDLIRACSLLRDRGVTFECRIVGEGDQRPALEALILSLGLHDVHLEGARTQEELGALFAWASLLAAPCVTASSGDRDGLPTVILEAMAAGVPVVATPVTAIPEVVHPGETGLLVAERSPGSIADSLVRLHCDRDLASHVASAARRLVEERHDATRNSARLAGLFAGVCRCA